VNAFNKHYASVGVIEELYNNMRARGMEYVITQKTANCILRNISGNEEIIQRHNQEHTNDRHALQNITDSSKLSFLVESDPRYFEHVKYTS
jgi:hypothetical protein